MDENPLHHGPGQNYNNNNNHAPSRASSRRRRQRHFTQGGPVGHNNNIAHYFPPKASPDGMPGMYIEGTNQNNAQINIQYNFYGQGYGAVPALAPQQMAPALHMLPPPPSPPSLQQSRRSRNGRRQRTDSAASGGERLSANNTPLGPGPARMPTIGKTYTMPHQTWPLPDKTGSGATLNRMKWTWSLCYQRTRPATSAGPPSAQSRGHLVRVSLALVLTIPLPRTHMPLLRLATSWGVSYTTLTHTLADCIVWKSQFTINKFRTALDDRPCMPPAYIDQTSPRDIITDAEKELMRNLAWTMGSKPHTPDFAKRLFSRPPDPQSQQQQ